MSDNKEYMAVKDLTDKHIGAELEIMDSSSGYRTRFTLEQLYPAGRSFRALRAVASDAREFRCGSLAVIVTPAPVVQPKEPTKLGQSIWIKEPRELLGVVADPGDSLPIRAADGVWVPWSAVLRRAGDRQIIVTDPPRWPDEALMAPERVDHDDTLGGWRWMEDERVEVQPVPDRIEECEWPADDKHLRDWEWHTVDDRFGFGHTARWNDQELLWECPDCDVVWTGGLRKYAWTRGERAA